MKLLNFFKGKETQRPSDLLKKNIDYPKYSDPYVILITNTTDEIKNWIIFGSNKYLEEKNYGSEKGIELKNYGNVENSYGSILEEFSKKKIKCGKIRVQSDNVKNILQTISHHTIRNTNGFSEPNYERRDMFLSIMMDAYQQQSDIIDFTPINLFIDEKTHFSGTIQPNSKIAFSIFPIEKIIDSNEKFDIPRLNGKNVAPVIIQTIEKNKSKSWFSKFFKSKKTISSKDALYNKF